MITIDKLKKNFGEKVAVDIEHYEINQGLVQISCDSDMAGWSLCNRRFGVECDSTRI
jgi:hypothetical protein